MSLTLGVLVSGRGTNLQAIIDSIKKGELNASIGVVVANKKDAYALERAEKYGIPTCCVLGEDYEDKREFEKEIIRVLKQFNVELVVLAGFMTILSSRFVQVFKNRIINVHPSLIPAFCGKGFYGEKVHQAVLEYGVKVTGATVHFVDEGTDTGPIILQKPVEVMDDDNTETLASRVLKVEHQLLPQAVKLFEQGRLKLEGRRVKILNGRGESHD